MKSFLVLLFMPLLAVGAETTRLQPSTFVDTESTAFVPLRLPASNARGLDIALTFDGTASNNVEIALGRDADGNGRLSFGETGLALGWDCGRLFVERPASGERYEEVPGDPAVRARRFSWHSTVKRGQFLGVTASSESDSVFVSFTTNAPAWLYSEDWNLMRLTARGPDDPDGHFAVTPREAGFLVNLR